METKVIEELLPAFEKTTNTSRCIMSRKIAFDVDAVKNEDDPEKVRIF